MTVKFGPAGAGGSTLDGIKHVKQLCLTAMEVEFVRGVKMSNQLAKQAGELAKKLEIELSVHAPYYINLNSDDRKKAEASKQRILMSCERAHYLGAEKVVFHPGYYGKIDRETTYNNIKNAILEIQEEIKKHDWKVKLAPETTGKLNVFGSVEEILRLIKDTHCSFCIDFAHIYARQQGKIDYKELLEKFHCKIHAHFSGIEFGAKGEKYHKITAEDKLKELLQAVKHRDITIINESPDPVGDSLKAKKIMENI